MSETNDLFRYISVGVSYTLSTGDFNAYVFPLIFPQVFNSKQKHDLSHFWNFKLLNILKYLTLYISHVYFKDKSPNLFSCL